ncbi:lytic transglycosylase domain-containing protein [Rhizobium sp. P44RR-XXIV]|uniref:lytic transglycosylase domain-containing protein n=1 Tax=Rhizobium sp. P44RR-XXIV TaxID=1921145 RepID=UPI0010A9D733|nr:lytic transglycosylase domain-containing protein [Rhizobium sp. P44RR-XXIV]TIX93091.1 lytic transglycosylase domain-containing protein [Rhizobium sp. P44RR-XXIV]
MRGFSWRFTFLLLSGLSANACATTASMARDDSYTVHLVEASRRFGMPVHWIRAIMRAESADNPRAISSAGAIGLMQVMPDTWTELRARYGLGGDPFDPHDNILAGAAYLRELYNRYGTPGFLAAYNAGPKRYEASLNGRPLPAETRAYVATLGPIIDSKISASAIIVAAADAPTSGRASHFIRQPDNGSGPTFLPAGRLSNDAPTISKVHDLSAIVPQSSELFVERTAERPVP